MNTQTTANDTADNATLEAAKATVRLLRVHSKQAIFDCWVKTCLGRVQNATMADQKKGWMIYDLIRAQYGRAIADQVA